MLIEVVLFNKSGLLLQTTPYVMPRNPPRKSRYGVRTFMVTRVREYEGTRGCERVTAQHPDVRENASEPRVRKTPFATELG